MGYYKTDFRLPVTAHSSASLTTFVTSAEETHILKNERTSFHERTFVFIHTSGRLASDIRSFLMASQQ
jgi:hypothetical protein